jgi:hypothetical protein
MFWAITKDSNRSDSLPRRSLLWIFSGKSVKFVGKVGLILAEKGQS